MKKVMTFSCLLLIILLSACKKTGTSNPSPLQIKCKPKAETTTLAGNNATYEYSFDANGKPTIIKKFIGGSYHVLHDSIVIGDYTVVNYHNLDYPAGSNIITTVYEGSIFDGLPAIAHVAITEGVITKTDVYTYFFFYDNKNRLTKVGEQTDHVIGDYEYDLSIHYNDHDNVTALSYEFTTGPRTITTITASGYDDKPNPFSGIKNWYFLMHAGWDNYDPEPVLTALSKNNPLGYTDGDWVRSMTYTYSDNGFPTKRTNTNTNSNGSASFDESFDYQCP